jgi:hypothetical protein
VKPDAKFVPPHEITEEDTRLKGFEWRFKERPVREDVVKTRPTSAIQGQSPPQKDPSPKKK